jgi:argininosuccinate synthase
MNEKTAVIAFSGGLDTSFLVPFSREKYGFDRIITCSVNTGGFGEEERAQIEARSKEVGADDHVLVNAEDRFYEKIIQYLIFGNVSRDGYPLSCGAERLIQAEAALNVCRETGAQYFLHGSTGAGNDQYRFDVAAYVLGKGRIECIAPVREFGISREDSTQFLKDRGISIPERNSKYSYNVGLWGVSIGGAETHTSCGLIPDDAWYSQPSADTADTVINICFKAGHPIRIITEEEETIEGPVEVIKALSALGSRYGIGHHYHVGTSIPGKKGRLAYESPAADLLYAAHREIEKIVLSQSQIHGKKLIAAELGRLIHEARFFDPYLEDLQAYLVQSQSRVNGSSKVYLGRSQIKAVTADSPHNLLSADGAVYGETAEFYSAADAAGAAKLHAFEQKILHEVDD